jgi:DNA-binding transcriptional regulator WhiA
VKISKFPKEINEQLAEEVGWHIGDGSMNFYSNRGKLKGIYQLRGHIDDDRDHYIKQIKPIFKNLYNIDISLREMPSTRVFGFQIWSDDLVKFKQELGLPLGFKIDIKIPQNFLNSKKIRIAVLRGIFDTDGCVYLERKNNKLYPRMEIGTISINLASQLKNIFSELGLRATTYKSYVGIKNKRDFYKVVIRGEEMFHNFVDIIKPKNQKHLDKYNRFIQSFK